MDNVCEGVVECTALLLAEGYTELDQKITLFSILNELRIDDGTPDSFVVYAKFESCEHAGEKERKASIVITDEEGEAVLESPEYTIWVDSSEAATVLAVFDLPEGLKEGGKVLWIEAIVDGETLSQTAVWLRERYSV